MGRPRLVHLLLVIVITLGASFSACGPKEEPISVQRTMFLHWYEAAVEKSLSLQDDCIALSLDALRLYADGTFSAYEAYTSVSAAKKNLAGLWALAYSRVPSQINTKRQDAARAAVKELQKGEDQRIAALDSLLAFLDAPAPSKLQGFEDGLEAARAHYEAGMKALKEVKKDMGLY